MSAMVTVIKLMITIIYLIYMFLNVPSDVLNIVLSRTTYKPESIIRDHKLEEYTAVCLYN